MVFLRECRNSSGPIIRGSGYAGGPARDGRGKERRPAGTMFSSCVYSKLGSARLWQACAPGFRPHHQCRKRGSLMTGSSAREELPGALVQDATALPTDADLLRTIER